MDALQKITENLSKCDAVNRLDQGDHLEAGAIAVGLSDMYGSFQKIFGDFVPRIIAAGNDNEVLDDLIFDVADELRHIQYHIAASRLFRDFCLDIVDEADPSDSTR